MNVVVSCNRSAAVAMMLRVLLSVCRVTGKFDDSAVFIRAELVTESLRVFGRTFEVCFDRSFRLTEVMTFTLTQTSEFRAVNASQTLVQISSDLCVFPLLCKDYKG